ncbi:hypothetical protein [uncultured Salinicola sp.]|uniref:hypothetical protein n=1 Tax=uncultured Salinicola sp. TaxID=1193542 RepID=UPI002619E8A0|nr:hypothetical protein [uncultured Salinicola sp.]|tara:strand:+ start:6403 stop:7257 length:855 start_codon:yes stop_codon:yes gene_type:complete
MKIQEADRRTGDFATDLDAEISRRFRDAGLEHHDISIERTNESSVTLVRSAPSNECRKNVTLVLSTPTNIEPKETVNLKELLRRRADRHSEIQQPRDAFEGEHLFRSYVERSIRATRRYRAMLSHRGTCERDPWTHTIHSVTKRWLEKEGCDLSIQGEAAYMNTLHPPKGVDVGEWYFIDGYAVCAGIQNASRDVKLFSNQTDRTVRLEIKRPLPEAVTLALPGRRIGEVVDAPFIEGNEDVLIQSVRRIIDHDGETVLSMTLHPSEEAMAEAPDGFDDSWMTM